MNRFLSSILMGGPDILKKSRLTGLQYILSIRVLDIENSIYAVGGSAL